MPKKTIQTRGGSSVVDKKGLDAVLKDIHQKFGDGAIMKMGNVERMKVETIPTGSVSLDIALGAGGVPKGRIVEIYGPESSGKTTLALHILSQSQIWVCVCFCGC